MHSFIVKIKIHAYVPFVFALIVILLDGICVVFFSDWLVGLLFIHSRMSLHMYQRESRSKYYNTWTEWQALQGPDIVKAWIDMNTFYLIAVEYFSATGTQATQSISLTLWIKVIIKLDSLYIILSGLQHIRSKKLYRLLIFVLYPRKYGKPYHWYYIFKDKDISLRQRYICVKVIKTSLT